MTRQQAIRDCILMFTGKEPPFTIRVTELRRLPDDKYEQLQSWLSCNVRMRWLTGIGTIEAIESSVYEAWVNGNLRDYHAYHPPERPRANSKLGGG
jgi:hypothetical protein